MAASDLGIACLRRNQMLLGRRRRRPRLPQVARLPASARGDLTGQRRKRKPAGTVPVKTEGPAEKKKEEDKKGGGDEETKMGNEATRGRRTATTQTRRHGRL